MDHLLINAITAVHPGKHHPASTVHAHVRHHSSVAKARARHHFRILGIRLTPHLRPQGPPLDYVALFLFAILSGIGINGFGEVALIGAAVYVANHNLPIEPVLLIAWLGAMLGGLVGWVIGWQAGRRLLTAPGPILHFRTRMLEHSEAVYYLHPTTAVMLTPSWAAGIEKVHWRQYLSLNALSAFAWALPLGLGAYFLGRQITTEFSNEIGWVAAIVVVLFVLYFVLQHFLRTPSRRSR
ncbi:MAG: DedA family protein [Solirubrobacteraceae bacterium]